MSEPDQVRAVTRQIIERVDRQRPLDPDHQAIIETVLTTANLETLMEVNAALARDRR